MAPKTGWRYSLKPDGHLSVSGRIRLQTNESWARPGFKNLHPSGVGNARCTYGTAAVSVCTGWRVLGPQGKSSASGEVTCAAPRAQQAGLPRALFKGPAQPPDRSRGGVAVSPGYFLELFLLSNFLRTSTPGDDPCRAAAAATPALPFAFWPGTCGGRTWPGSRQRGDRAALFIRSGWKNRRSSPGRLIPYRAFSLG